MSNLPNGDLPAADPNLVDAEAIKNLTLGFIARLIRKTWVNKKGESTVYFGAVPYLSAMGDLNNIEDTYGMDSGQSIVLYFLSNASTYRGPQAKIVKAELKRRIK
jgi:hypothetical protein